MVTQGTPFVGRASLTNGAPGPTSLALVVNGASHTLGATERVYVSSIAISSNDTGPLVTLDDGGGTAGTNKLARVYVGASLPPYTESVAPGVCRCTPGATPRATSSSVTAGKTVEVVVTGYIART